jgi:hypothetical protein
MLLKIFFRYYMALLASLKTLETLLSGPKPAIVAMKTSSNKAIYTLQCDCENSFRKVVRSVTLHKKTGEDDTVL